MIFFRMSVKLRRLLCQSSPEYATIPDDCMGDDIFELHLQKFFSLTRKKEKIPNIYGGLLNLGLTTWNFDDEVLAVISNFSGLSLTFYALARQNFFEKPFI